MTLAWKFIAADHRLRYSHDPRILVAGETLVDPKDKITGAIVTHPQICESGFHASIKARDALRYAPGSHIARVEIGGRGDSQHDKICGTECKVLWISDAAQVLRRFAVDRREAQMMHRLDGRDPSLVAIWVIDCARRYINGEADGEEMAAATAAAAAATAAAYAAATAAAYAAATAATAAARSAAAAAAAATTAAAYAAAAAATTATTATAATAAAAATYADAADAADAAYAAADAADAVGAAAADAVGAAAADAADADADADAAADADADADADLEEALEGLAP
jgi:hypothetical protein